MVSGMLAVFMATISVGGRGRDCAPVPAGVEITASDEFMRDRRWFRRPVRAARQRRQPAATPRPPSTSGCRSGCRRPRWSRPRKCAGQRRHVEQARSRGRGWPPARLTRTRVWVMALNDSSRKPAANSSTSASGYQRVSKSGQRRAPARASRIAVRGSGQPARAFENEAREKGAGSIRRQQHAVGDAGSPWHEVLREARHSGDRRRRRRTTRRPPGGSSPPPRGCRRRPAWSARCRQSAHGARVAACPWRWRGP